MIKTLSITLVALAWCSISFGQNQGQPAQGTPAQGQVGGDVAAPPKLAGSLTLNTKNTRYSGDEHIFLNIDLQNKGSVLFKFSESEISLAPFVCSVSFSQTKTDNKEVQKKSESPIAVLEEDSARIIASTYKGKVQYGGDESIVLGISLKNIGTKPFGANGAGDPVDFFYDFDVTGPSGGKVSFLPPHERRQYYSGVPMWTVYPDKERDGSVWLNNLFDLDHVGQYKVVVSKKFRRNNAIVTVSSEPFTFEITSLPLVAQWSPR